MGFDSLALAAARKHLFVSLLPLWRDFRHLYVSRHYTSVSWQRKCISFLLFEARLPLKSHRGDLGPNDQIVIAKGPNELRGMKPRCSRRDRSFTLPAKAFARSKYILAVPLLTAKCTVMNARLLRVLFLSHSKGGATGRGLRGSSVPAPQNWL